MLYYNRDLQANGFRSMLRVVNTLVRHCSDIMETVRHQLATLGYVAPEVMMIMNDDNDDDDYVVVWKR